MSKLLARQRKLSACSFKHQLLDLSFINCFFSVKFSCNYLLLKYSQQMNECQLKHVHNTLKQTFRM